MKILEMILLVLLAVLVAIVWIGPWRRACITGPLLRLYRRILPHMSDTEREALEAGTVWWDGDLFRGRPDWRKLLNLPKPGLQPHEQAFLDHEVDQVCRMVDDWQVSHETHDLPAAVWDYIKAQGFFGMIIPTQYGGLGFSAYAHSQVMTRLSTRCSALAVSVMVPNSLGPAELLLHYGTEQQKNHYLPRLARGLEIPAFALTSPWAGSDAAAIPDRGIVCKGMWQGREVLGMRVSWDKRYITLAPVCTLLGLAFRLYDPDGLLGSRQDIGITCALVPHDHPGVEIGRRHFPLNAVFMNGPTRGTDVFMPLDFIIGGPSMAGQGWRMLMECLAAGRSISLPASNTGMAKLTAHTVGAYARVRSQFKTAVGKFEGVEEALARIGGNTYLVDAVRTLTAQAVDLGERPSVVSAIAKYHVTERAREVVNDGMDVLGGKGICLGPSNFLGRAYQQVPIGITVEGANILTRSLILFGQGAIRCHPHVLHEMQAAQNPDAAQALHAFDAALCGHARYAAGNALRAVWLGVTGAAFRTAPLGVAAETRRYYPVLDRYAAALALMSEVAMMTLGGDLKRREKLSARLGDVLSQLYLVSAVLKRFEDDGRPADDAPLMHWSVQDALHRTQQAFDGLLANFPGAVLPRVLRALLFPWGAASAPPSDALGHAVARLLVAPSATRARLTAGMFFCPSEDDPVGVVELALEATLAAEPLDAKIREAEKQGLFANNPLANVRDMADAAHAAGVLRDDEHALLKRRDHLRDIAIRVDDFPMDFGLRCVSAHDAQQAAG